MVVNNFAKAVTTAYTLSLEKNPMFTEMATTGCLWCLGDLATQQVERYSSKKSYGGIDWKRTLNQMIYASIIWGPFAHKWYHVLDHFAESAVEATASIAEQAIPTSPRLVVIKMILEMVLLHPISLLVYFIAVGFLNGEVWLQIQRQVISDYPQTLGLEVFLWSPFDLLLFALVPVRHQLLVVNCACFLESIALSFVKNNGIDAFKNAIPIPIPFLGNNNKGDSPKKNAGDAKKTN